MKIEELKEVELIKLYKESENNIKKKELVFNEFYKRYEKFLYKKAYEFLKRIDSQYYGFEFDDCFQECLLSLKQAIDFFDIKKVDEKTFIPEKYSISFLVEKYINSKISYINNRKNNKNKFSVKAENVDLIDLESFIFKNESINKKLDLEWELNLILENIDEKLNETQRKIKKFLLLGFKESKIRSLLSLTKKKYEKNIQEMKKIFIEYHLDECFLTK